MKLILSFSFFCLSLAIFSCQSKEDSTKIKATNNNEDSVSISAMLDSFNVYAAQAKYNKYFNLYTNDATFLGTDATEHWNKQAFMIWTKPYFDKKKTWNFTSLQRHIYFGKEENIAWFDELLQTQMKICRGSGVVVKESNSWKVQQYVLCMTIPNSSTKDVVKLKSGVEDSMVQSIRLNREKGIMNN
jgi:SnoaL-like domain